MKWHKERTIRESLILITFIVFLLSGGGILYYFNQYSLSEQTYRQIHDMAYAVADMAEPEEMPQDRMGDGSLLSLADPIDHDALSGVNDDYVGWITVDGTPIDYPMARGDDNVHYLYFAFDGTKDFSGSVFMDFLNRQDMSDDNTILYGHHMKNGMMFASLDRFMQKEFFENNRFITIRTAEGLYSYEIFAVYEKPADKVYYYPGNLDEEHYLSFVDSIMKNAVNYKDISLKHGNRFISLVTCGYSVEDARVVLHGVLVNEVKWSKSDAL